MSTEARLPVPGGHSQLGHLLVMRPWGGCLSPGLCSPEHLLCRPWAPQGQLDSGQHLKKAASVETVAGTIRSLGQKEEAEQGQVDCKWRQTDGQAVSFKNRGLGENLEDQSLDMRGRILQMCGETSLWMGQTWSKGSEVGVSSRKGGSVENRPGWWRRRRREMGGRHATLIE